MPCIKIFLVYILIVYTLYTAKIQALESSKGKSVFFRFYRFSIIMPRAFSRENVVYKCGVTSAGSTSVCSYE
jgi:hypothetical protein